VLCALALCWFLVMKRTRRLGYSSTRVLLLLVLGLPVGVIGGIWFNRLIPFIFGLKGIEPNGLTVIGSIVFAIGFGALYVKYVLKAPPLPLLDAAAFTLPLSIGLGRFGCLLNGCCFGMLAPDWARTSLLRALTIPVRLYTPNSFAGQTLKGTLPGDVLLWYLPLMLMIHELGVLVVAETLYRNRERWGLLPGTVLAAAVAQEAGGRFFLEFLRWDEHVGAGVFNAWQLSVAAIALVAIAALSGRLVGRNRPAGSEISSICR
jgi:phosphatidylglycerol:prolipoprotein diacylglycerol transferase